jgi:chemotaxis protein histidine kinase CheA
VTATSVEQVNGTPVASEPRVDPVRVAEAEAIRARAAAERQALLTAAEGEKALKAQQAEQLRLENEKQALANERAAVRFEREKAEQLAKTAEANRKREDTERAREAARRQEEAQKQAEAANAKAAKKSSERWRRVAMGFYALCAAVALPVQMAAFYDEDAKYLLVAPVFIEVIALVALVGAAAAVTDERPQWHYRLVAWAGALTAATINVVHGLDAFDPATAFGTALASIAGPGMWDLHEHGRIRKLDGKPTWRERRAQRNADSAAAKEQAAEEKRRAAEKAAAEEAAAERARELAERRATLFPKVWEHAMKLAADLGETTVTQAVWERAKLDVEGAKPGESAEVLRMRNAAQARVEAARQNKPVSTLSKTTNAQRAIQTPRSGYKPVPPRRTKGDTPRYSRAAGRAHSELLRTRNAAKKDAS